MRPATWYFGSCRTPFQYFYSESFLNYPDLNSLQEAIIHLCSVHSWLACSAQYFALVTVPLMVVCSVTVQRCPCNLQDEMRGLAEVRTILNCGHRVEFKTLLEHAAILTIGLNYHRVCWSGLIIFVCRPSPVHKVSWSKAAENIFVSTDKQSLWAKPCVYPRKTANSIMGVRFRCFSWLACFYQEDFVSKFTKTYLPVNGNIRCEFEWLVIRPAMSNPIGWLGQKNHVAILTRAAHLMTYQWGPHIEWLT